LQVSCPQCSQRIAIDDAKVPDRPFSIKCPKCQTVVKLPGRTAAPPSPEPAPAESAAPAAPAHAQASAPAQAPAPAAAPKAASAPTSASDEERAQVLAQIRREIAVTGSPSGGRALVALSDRGQAGAMTAPLGRHGYHVDTLENPDEGARLLEQGLYDIVVTTRAAAGGGRESLYQRVGRFNPDARRRVFMILVGEDFKTGDGTQAWAAAADLVLNPRDVANVDTLLLNTLGERTRLFQTFLDARRRFEESAG
jgi:predicted Zn finger-like uncharacterized protein